MASKEMIETITQSLAREQYGRISSIAQETGQNQFGDIITWSNFTCPYCELAELQPVYRQRTYIKGGSIVGYACQSETCRARGVLIEIDPVQSLLDKMIEQRGIQNEAKS